MHRRNVSIVLISVLCLLLLGALPVVAQERVQVVWYVGLGAGGQPQQVDAQNQVVEEFNASQSEIELIIVQVENNVAYDTLATLIASGQTPDIVGPVGNDGSNAFAGNYLDLTSLIESSGYDLSQYPEAAVAAYNVEGEGQIGLPFATFPAALYYRTSLFDEAGVAYPPSEYGAPYVDADGNERPWDMDALRDLAMFLSVDENGNDATMEEFDPSAQVQWGFIHQWNEPRGISTLFGATSLVGEDGTSAVMPEAWVNTFNWYYDGIWTDHFIPNAAQIGSDLMTGNAFASGAVAMANTHLWYTCCIGDQNDWNVAALPAYNEEGDVVAKLHGDTFRIMKQTEHPEEAFAVLTHLLGPASGTLLQVYGGMPARPEETEAFFATLDETYPQGVNWDVFLAGLDYPDNPNHEYNMPNYLKAKDRIAAFQTLYDGTPGLDIEAELETLRSDLELIFNEVQ